MRGEAQIVSEPTLGALKQGTILNCCFAENYDECEVYGVVITARCDLAQSKVNVVTILPVVRIEDWILKDGYEVCLSRIRRDLESRLKSYLANLKISDSVLNSVSLDELISSIAAEEPPPKAKFLEGLRDVSSMQAMLLADPPDRQQILRKNPKLCEKVISELTLNGLSGYYYIPYEDEYKNTPGYVVLLREPRSMPIDVAQLICSGLPSDRVSGDSKVLRYVNFQFEDFAMPIVQLNSPHVEHLLQTFTLLFGRIGLPDLTDDQLEAPKRKILEDL